MKIAIIGFGEAGHMFGKGLSAQADVFAYDINITPEMQLNAEAAHVSLSRDLSAALKDAQIVFSLVTADQAQCAARSAAPLLEDDQVYFEMNSIAPDTKRSNADLIPSLVDAAIMAPVYPQELSVPLLLAHPDAQIKADKLCALGLNAMPAGDQIGDAAAIKMCRSIMIKGMEALTIECFLTARHYGVEDAVKASLQGSFPEMGWNKDRVDYWFERVSTHGKRRAAEMREAAKTVKNAKIPTQISFEIAKAQDIYHGILKSQ